jgi:hypothetical protein
MVLAVNLKDREFGWRAALLIVGRLPSSGKGIGMALRSALSRPKDRFPERGLTRGLLSDPEAAKVSAHHA